MENKEREKGKGKRGKSFLTEVVCPICGKVFYPTPLWAWKIGYKKYCRYNCKRVEEKRQQEKRKKKVLIVEE